jgi:hypothetical protein
MGFVEDMYYSDGTPKPGWENDIMANVESGWPSERDIQVIIEKYKYSKNGPNCP